MRPVCLKRGESQNGRVKPIRPLNSVKAKAPNKIGSVPLTIEPQEPRGPVRPDYAAWF